MAHKITDVCVHALDKSMYVRPLRLVYKQDGKDRVWDYIHAHNSVAILLFNVEREVFVVVNQFRPAVYAAKAKAFTVGDAIDTEKYPGEEGMTIELCAGIVDKDASLPEIAKMEVLEETGYEITVDSLEKITSFRAGVGLDGTRQTIYYAEINDSMKKNKGGGSAHEGEMINVKEIPLEDMKSVIYNEQIEKPAGFILAFLWFFSKKWKRK